MTHQIEWTDATWNPVVGCAGDRHFNGTVRCIDEALEIPLRWRRPRRIFVNSMSDLFHRDVPFEFIDKVFAVMALCPQHTFQILTKQPERMAEYFRSFSGMYQRACIAFNPYIAWPHDRDRVLDIVSGKRAFRAMRDEPLPNVWLGCSIEDQKTADERIPHLLKCPAAVRFLSCEPLLGAVDLKLVEHVPYLLHGSYGKSEGIGSRIERRAIHWVIVGGESGPKARPCDVRWILRIVKQCKRAAVPVFVKQLGAFVVDRDDVGFEAYLSVWADGPDAGQPTDSRAWPRPVDVEFDIHGFREEYQGAPVRVHLRDRKGGDPSEWPEDLRVRQWPEVKR